MAIYKDYGSPAEYSSSDSVAGALGGINQRGNVTVTRSDAQFRGAEAPLARALRTKDTPTVWQIADGATLVVGDLDTVTGDLDESSKRFKITSLDGTTDVMELDWDGTDLTLNGSVTGSVLELAAAASGAGNIAFSADADGNLSIIAGASAGADLILRRIDGV